MKERERTGEQKEFNSLLKEIPLKDCSYEYDLVVKEWGWRAPKDKIFRVTGQFMILCNQSDYCDGLYGPEMSVEMLINENPEKYNECLDGREGNREEALELLHQEVLDFPGMGMPPNFFDGKWLRISSKLGEEPCLLIRGDAEIQYNNECSGEIDDISPESEIETGCLFNSTTRSLHWQQYYIEMIPNKSKVQLVDSLENKEIVIFESTKNEKIELPEEVSSRERQNKDKRKALNNFDKDNKNLVFNELPPWRGDLLIAHKRVGDCIPRKRKER